ncbi:DNA-3-methyladenine glycosylase I [Salinimicrobium tongyeongense]|uniref:DNA-3-methyladenine glycosylase I n=1 Tax=Salinimicrobium tongyeongense TaxID=2809707 RepID=A0ABY6NUA1_9FLAO|nr:DNA-3-methyladenine glycosylase I [Salinimicrobium tongyeongense]UZH56378.1 DNA-3-methyladenine glycosylase I [Salinimicrobium tongyeongense]
MEEKTRCSWCVGDSLYEEYHDREWGVPLKDDAKIFEFLMLETFQAGLSWITILRKRENFRKAFDNFDYEKIATYSEAKQAELLENSGIIRHGAKIRAAITNAQAFMRVQEEFGSFSRYIWSFVDGSPIQNDRQNLAEVPPTTAISEKLSKDLKKRGFKFVGPTVVYAHMQATGMVNDHVAECFRHQEVKNLS